MCPGRKLELLVLLGVVVWGGGKNSRRGKGEGHTEREPKELFSTFITIKT